MGNDLSTAPMRGRSVFVAGGSSGINLEIARAFASAGAGVAILGRNQTKIDEAVASLRDVGNAVGFSADVRDSAAVADALMRGRDQLGPFDVVVSGAAGNFIAPALGMSSNGFRSVVDIDLIGTFNVFRHCFAHLKKPGASLIAISAPQGAHPAMFQAHACAAKAGVNMLTRCLAMEWGPAGVRVNAISPGPITDTEGMRRLVGSAESARSIENRLALRRLGEKRDISDLALFLAGEQARYITGAILDCDGGLALGDASGDALSASD